MKKCLPVYLIALMFASLAVAAVSAGGTAHGADNVSTLAPLVLGGAGESCRTDPDCINRFHYDIPMKQRPAWPDPRIQGEGCHGYSG